MMERDEPYNFKKSENIKETKDKDKKESERKAMNLFLGLFHNL